VCSKRKSKRENVVGSATVKVIWKFLLMACNVTAPTSLILCEVRILMWCVCVRACKKQRKKTGISHFNLRCKSFDLPPPPSAFRHTYAALNRHRPEHRTVTTGIFEGYAF